jgi:hypothetical protein
MGQASETEGYHDPSSGKRYCFLRSLNYTKSLYEVQYRCDRICYMFINGLNKADRIQTINPLGMDDVHIRRVSN